MLDIFTVILPRDSPRANSLGANYPYIYYFSPRANSLGACVHMPALIFSWGHLRSLSNLNLSEHAMIVGLTCIWFVYNLIYYYCWWHLFHQTRPLTEHLFFLIMHTSRLWGVFSHSTSGIFLYLVSWCIERQWSVMTIFCCVFHVCMQKKMFKVWTSALEMLVVLGCTLILMFSSVAIHVHLFYLRAFLKAGEIEMPIVVEWCPPCYFKIR